MKKQKALITVSILLAAYTALTTVPCQSIQPERRLNTCESPDDDTLMSKTRIAKTKP